MLAETMHEIRSAAGMLAQMPQSPKKCGKMNINGRRNSSCLVSDRKIDVPAYPMLLKKFDVTIWNPTIG